MGGVILPGLLAQLLLQGQERGQQSQGGEGRQSGGGKRLYGGDKMESKGWGEPEGKLRLPGEPYLFLELL